MANQQHPVVRFTVALNLNIVAIILGRMTCATSHVINWIFLSAFPFPFLSPVLGGFPGVPLNRNARDPYGFIGFPVRLLLFFLSFVCIFCVLLFLINTSVSYLTGLMAYKNSLIKYYLHVRWWWHVWPDVRRDVPAHVCPLLGMRHHMCRFFRFVRLLHSQHSSQKLNK